MVFISKRLSSHYPCDNLYKRLLRGLTVPATRRVAGQARSIPAIKQCSLIRDSFLHRAQEVMQFSLLSLVAALGISAQWAQIAVNCFLIFYQFSSVIEARFFLSPLQLSTSPDKWPTFWSGGREQHWHAEWSPQRYLRTFIDSSSYFKSSHLRTMPLTNETKKSTLVSGELH